MNDQEIDPFAGLQFEEPSQEDMQGGSLREGGLTDDEILARRDQWLDDAQYRGIDFTNEPGFLDEQSRLALVGKVEELRLERNRYRADERELRRQLRYFKTKDDTRTRFEAKAGSAFGRLPPQDRELEQIVLGMYMAEPSLMEGFNQKHLNLMFYFHHHSLVHGKMMDLGRKLDFASLESALRMGHEYEEIGGEHELLEIRDAASRGTTEGIPGYISTLEDLFLRRNLILLGHELANEGYDGNTGGRDSVDVESWPEHIRLAAGRVLDLLPLKHRVAYDTGNAVTDIMDRFREFMARGGRPEISTGYRKLDGIMHGILPNRLVVVGARTKQGKTTFGLNIAKQVAEQGHDAAIFTFESSRSSLLQKLISNYSGVDSQRFVYWDGATMPENQVQSIEDAAERVRNLPLHIDGSKPNLEYVVNRCRQLKAVNPDLALVVVDGLQSFKYEPYKSKADTYYEVLTRLKEMAGDLRLTVMLNAQLKMDVEKRPNKRPIGLSDFSDTKGVAEVADTAIMLYRPAAYWPEDPSHKNRLYIDPVAMREGDASKRSCEMKLVLPTSRLYNQAMPRRKVAPE